MWTEEMVQELRRLVDTEHRTCAQAALSLGCTKNAVCGKLYRMKPRPPMARLRATDSFIVRVPPTPILSPSAGIACGGSVIPAGRFRISVARLTL